MVYLLISDVAAFSIMPNFYGFSIFGHKISHIKLILTTHLIFVNKL